MDIQAKRKLVTDEIVAEFMRPRPLSNSAKSKTKPKYSTVPTDICERLDDYLSDRSYLEAYEFSEVDAAVMSSLSTNSSSSQSFVHFNRWFRHITALTSSGASPKKSPREAFEVIEGKFGAV